uniref:Pre-mRNA-splicing factor SYF1 n=2 Tax=Plectus sambesii TaxID=2011161 RepID=A0A914VZD4_9BILA
MPDLDVEESTGESRKKFGGRILFEDQDLPYEEDILRNPFSLKCWLRYIDHKKQTKSHCRQINTIYERALKELPGSYKLWYNYLRYRRKQMRKKCVTDPAFEDLNNCFERALVFMHKMPRIWLDYCQTLVDQRLITRTRKTFDRALRSLPVTQHDRIWPLYLSFVKMHNIPETSVRAYRRYLKLDQSGREAFIDYLREIDRLDVAATQLAILVNDEKFVSIENKSNHQLWTELCELISKNPGKVHSLQVDPIIRQGIKRYTDQVGALWCSLAEYYIRAGHFEKARDIYEEAVVTVKTVRDFTQVFDAYAQFEERATGAKMEELAAKAGGPTEDDDLEIELRLARFEHLMDRRPLLVNSVLLRQNPHNVHEWLKRVELYEGQPQKQIETFTEAVRTVDPKLQTGKLFSIWVAFAKFYEKNKQLDDARMIFEKALEARLSKVEELAAVWCEYAEMELRHNDVERAVKLMKRATAPPPQKTHYFDESEPIQNRVYKSLKLWSMFADLEESFGTFASCKAVYDRIVDLKIATPQIIINYAMFLEENNYFEEAFKAYEKGLSLFKWPLVYDIWNTYLTKFIKRYGGKKLERARDLFEQCLESCPAKFTKNLYLLYAKLEEEHGLARHAMNIYNRATRAVEKDEMYAVFNIYIKKAAELYGVTHTRPIYEDAIESLPEDRARDMCLRFAELEKKLGEIDRARAIYAHASHICDPRVHPQFWEVWKDFEVRHGNEDTVREMLRIKRAVQATYNTNVNFMSAQMLAASSGAIQTPADITAGDSMALLEAKAQRLAAEEEAQRQLMTAGGASRTVAPKGGNISFVRGETTQTQSATIQAENPDEIDIDDEDEEDDADDAEEAEDAESAPRKKGVTVEKQTVPSAVFGSLAKDDDDE